MLPTTLFLMALSQAPDVNPDALVSEMLAKYASATSMVGSVTLTQAAMDQRLRIQSQFAFATPSKFTMTQQRAGSNEIFGAKSDGKQFVYSPPRTLSSAPPLVREMIKRADGSTLSVQELYMVQRLGMLDRSPAFMVLFGVRSEMRYFANQLVNLKYAGTTRIGDTEAHVVRCQWRENPDEMVTGKAELFITKEKELVRYSLVQTFGIPAQAMPDVSVQVGPIDRIPRGAGNRTDNVKSPNNSLTKQAIVKQVTVTSIWDVRTQLGVTPEDRVFSLKG